MELIDPDTELAKQVDAAIGPKRLGGTPAARAKGRATTRAGRQMTSLAQHFRDAGLDWRADFADAIKKRNWRLIQLYMKLMPYMLTGKATTKASKAWGGTKKKLTKAALAKLTELEELGL